MHDQVREQYPTVEQVVTSSLTFQAGASVQLGASQQHSGYLFRSPDGIRVFQANVNGFSFHQLRPYDSWESFRGEARRLWGIYRDTCKPTTVTRAELRYINRLELPSTLQDFKEYLRTVPEIPAEIPYGLSGFFMQAQMPQLDLECMLVINETLVPQSDPALLPVILDFDLFREQVWQSDDDEVWTFLDQLRVRKNELFEASVTDAARKLFD